MTTGPERYDACLAWLQAECRLPSVTAAVARAGEPVWRGVAGPLSGDRYRIGSITKTMTAVLVLQLRDEGRLSLDDPVGRHLPTTGYGEATLRELLAHTSGMQSEPTGPWWERSEGGDAEELMAANDGSGRVAPAGEYWHYSNLGYGLLGEVVARLRGTSWYDAVVDRLLTPLGMKETSYQPETEAPARGLSVDHFAGTLTAEPHTDTGAMAAAGQLWSTVDDLLRWADFLVTGHPEVLAVETLEEMRRPVPPALAYGLGLRLLPYADRTLVGHTGSMPGFQASLFVDPASRDAVAVLANSTTGLPSNDVAAFLLGDTPVAEVEPWRPTEQVPDRVRELLGVWFWGHTALGVEWRNERLEFRALRTGALEYRFAATDAGWVGVDGYHQGERLDVVRRPDGTLSHLVCATFVYTRTPYDAGAPIPGGHPA